MPATFEKIVYCSLFLLFAAIVSGLNAALQRLGRTQTKEELKRQGMTFFPKLLKFFLPGHEWDSLLFSLNFAKLIFYLVFGLTTFYFFMTDQAIKEDEQHHALLMLSTSFSQFFIEALIAIVLSLITDVFMQFLGASKPKFWFKTLSIPASLLLTITLPITLGFLKVLTLFFPKKTQFDFSPSYKVKDKILEWLHESEIESLLDKHEKKLIYSVVSFKDRIAREVMVPRINVFSLSVDTTIKEAAVYFTKEGYSRIPVYKESVDQIIGVLLYKDVMSTYMKLKEEQKEGGQPLSKSIEQIVKPVLYTPETKKISHLLQEFRIKQIHLAIVVDEYGGTEGILTIEDILEELVGEISDEYDIQEEKLFSSLATGGWIIDAKMSIIDIEEELGIKIPHSVEYDTIGGYIFHRAGSIPSKGWKIHHDDFDLEVLSSEERSINKIKIIPHSSAKGEND